MIEIGNDQKLATESVYRSFSQEEQQLLQLRVNLFLDLLNGTNSYNDALEATNEIFPGFIEIERILHETIDSHLFQENKLTQKSTFSSED